MKRYSRKQSFGAMALFVCKMAVSACILTAALVLLLALSMRWNWITMAQVDGVNTAIKALSACCIGVMAALKRTPKVWIQAGIAAILYIVLAFAVFGVLNGGFQISTKNISDILMAFACGACTCILTAIVLESRGEGKKG